MLKVIVPVLVGDLGLHVLLYFFLPSFAIVQSNRRIFTNNLIGQGSYGSVFKGILDGDGIEVAVKVLNLQNKEHQRTSWQNLKPLETFDIRI